MVMRYTRVSGKQADMYISTTAVVMAEIVKVMVALAMQLKVRATFRVVGIWKEESGDVAVCVPVLLVGFLVENPHP